MAFLTTIVAGKTNHIDKDVMSYAKDFLDGNSGIVGTNDLLVTQSTPAAMSVTVGAGVIYYYYSSGATYYRHELSDAATILTIDANSSGSTRVDLICVKTDLTATPDENGGGIASLVVVKGTAGAGAPATPANHYKLAEVSVENGAVSIENADITDTRASIVFKIGNTLPTDTGGWTAIDATLTYSSADDPNFVLSTSVDLRSVLSVGMKIMFTNNSTTFFGFIQAITINSITVYGGTDYDVANSEITNPYYSPHKAPLGFPMSPAKWTIEVTDTTSRTQNTPTQNTWYNGGSLAISIPIGAWLVYYKASAGYGDTGIGDVNYSMTLSTASNSESDADFTTFGANAATSGIFTYGFTHLSAQKTIVLASKTTYYLNAKTGSTDVNTLYCSRGDLEKTIIRAVCAYL